MHYCQAATNCYVFLSTELRPNSPPPANQTPHARTAVIHFFIQENTCEGINGPKSICSSLELQCKTIQAVVLHIYDANVILFTLQYNYLLCLTKQ